MPGVPDARLVERARASIAEIGERYRHSAAEQLAVLDRAVTALTDGTLQEGLRHEAERQAHKLAGSAGTFGFERASDLAQELEELLTDRTAARRARPRELLDALQAELAGPVAAAPASPSSDGPTLLIVDADADMARRLAVEADAVGLQTEIAGDTRQVRELLDRRRLDVALVGRSLEGATQALELLRQLGAARPPIPALVWTDGDGLMDRVEVARLGGRGFLPRASPPSQILQAVTDVLDRQRASDPTVLAVDDDPMMLEAVRGLLESQGMRVVALNDPAGFWESVQQTTPDLVVLDVDMPEVDGVALCRVLRNDRRWAQLPVLFLTARTDRATIQRVFTAGADDFVAKPIIGPELVTRITNRLERVQLFRSLAETDSLTGVANRRRSTQVLEHYLSLARRFSQPLTVAILDLDHFKQVNDRYGHTTGDRVLRGLASQLGRSFRGEDIVARWGGEEFLVGMYGMDRLDGVHRLADFLEVVRDERLASPDDSELQVSFSAGVAQYPDDGTDLPALYRAADQALYQAKQAGRNRVLAAGHHEHADRRVDVAIAVHDDTLAGLLLDRLTTRGHSARRFKDAAAAAAALTGPEREITARVLLVDEDLGGRDGHTVHGRLADTEVLAGSRVIVLTASRDEAGTRMPHAAGAFDHVIKPIQVPALLQHIRLALRATPTGPN